MPIRTLCDILAGLEKRAAKPDLLRYKAKDAWRSIAAAEFVSTVRSLALGLDGLGVKRGEKVAILCENRPEWAAFDHALLNLGAVVVPIYPSLLGDQVRFILDHCGARSIVLSTEAQLGKVVPLLGSLPALARIIVLDPPADMPTQALSWSVLLREGEAVHQADPGRFERLRGAVSPEDLASILYTSGTTAQPKGVMLTHANLAAVVSSTLEAIPIDDGTIDLSFLPLSHAFERVVQLACLAAGATVAFAESIEAVAQNLQEVEPTLLATVPRLLEKMHARVGDALRSSSSVRRGMFAVAMAAGRSKVRARQANRRVPLWAAAIGGEAERLVHAPLRSRLFGRRIRLVISGAAPLRREIAEFFHAAGVMLLEGYGLTEASPVVSVNTPQRLRLGTVGPPLPGVEVRIAEDGEVLVGGANVMKGYLKDDEATRAAVREGWLYTGDVGNLQDGFLSITDRKKEIFKTSGGKMVPPQPIEHLLSGDPSVSQVVLVGDGRKFIAALIVPDFAWLSSYARRERIPFAQTSDLVKEPRVVDHFRRLVEAKMAGLPTYETVKKFRLLSRDLSVDEGELTPTLKPKRRIIEAKYADLIASMYNE